MTVRSVGDLVNGQDPLAVAPDVTVHAAVLAMRQRRVGAVAVVEDRLVVGVFTERDVMVRVVAELLDPQTTLVAEVMTANPRVMPPEGGLVEALEHMIEGHYRHMPVARDGRLVGMLSMRDIPLEYRLMRQNWHAAKHALDAVRARAI